MALVAYQVQHRNFHHALIEVCGAIFHNFDGNNLLRFEILAFNDLAKCPLSEHVKDEISVPWYN